MPYMRGLKREPGMSRGGDEHSGLWFPKEPGCKYYVPIDMSSFIEIIHQA